MTRDGNQHRGGIPDAQLRNQDAGCLRAALSGPAVPSGRALGVLGSDQLCDLRGVEGRALAEVVAAHEEVDGPGIVE